MLREIRLAPDGRFFTGVVSAKLYDLSDTQFLAGCKLEDARRLY